MKPNCCFFSSLKFNGLIVFRLKKIFGYVAEKLYNCTKCRHRVFRLKSFTVENFMLFKSFSATVVSEFSSSAIDGVGIQFFGDGHVGIQFFGFTWCQHLVFRLHQCRNLVFRLQVMSEFSFSATVVSEFSFLAMIVSEFSFSASRFFCFKLEYL